uniref:S41 family peptidase n=1 Tax=Candidatus Ventrenecus sp. TaxID=3085654 RepID=UPI003FF0EE82
MKSRKGFSLKSVAIIIIVTAIITSLTTGLIIYNNSKLILGSASLSNDSALKEFLKVYSSLDENYYEDIDKTKMIDAAIAAMLKYLGEDYSTYLNQTETDSLSNKLSGTFKGIGISITNGNEIVKVYEDTPAFKAGLKENDKIIRINDTDTEGKNQIEVANLIDKTKENTLVVSRDGAELTFKVIPEEINTPLTTQVYEKNDKKIGYIYIEAFTEKVGEEFKKSLEDLEQQGITSLIIDVRENTGGYLKGATEIASLFLEKGKNIYSLEGKDGVTTYKDETDEKRDYPIILLINENTASASEVLAAALQDSYGAKLVGKISYGKGKVQQTKQLEDGSMVKYTSARWLTPEGECIDGFGLAPHYEEDIVQNEDGTYTDNQLNKAIELLS